MFPQTFLLFVIILALQVGESLAMPLVFTYCYFKTSKQIAHHRIQYTFQGCFVMKANLDYSVACIYFSFKVNYSLWHFKIHTCSMDENGLLHREERYPTLFRSPRLLFFQSKLHNKGFNIQYIHRLPHYVKKDTLQYYAVYSV